MKTLDKYLFSQVLGATVVALLLFIIIWICPEILFKIIKKLIYGQIEFHTAMHLLALEIPEVIGKSIAVGLMLGSLFVFDKLSRDSELTIFKGIGLSFGRISIPIIIIGLIGTFVSFAIGTTIIPKCNNTLKSMQKDIKKTHFVYVDRTETQKPKQILVVGWYNGALMGYIKLIKFSHKLDEYNPLIDSIYTSDWAHYKKDNWTLNDGVKYVIGEDGVYKEVSKFDEYKFFTPEVSKTAFELLEYSSKKAREMTNEDLKDYMKILEKNNLMDEYRYIDSKYHQRFAHPFACLFFVLLGVVLGYSKPREKRIWGFTIGVGVIFLYFILIPFTDVLTQYGILTPLIAAWAPNIILAITLFALIKTKKI